MKIVITESQLKLLVESENMGSILIVGDSHTVDNGVTWSSLMKKNFDNVTVRAIGGKRTSWMKEQLTDALSKQHYDKVIIWGGSNDAFSLVSINNAISNLQEMVNMVKAQNGTPYVIVGYDNRTFIDPEKMEPTRFADKEQMKKYRDKMIQLQSEIGNKITGAVIIPMFGLSNSYTNDNIHGNVSAHRIVFDDVQKYIKQNPITKDLTSSEKENSESDFLKNIQKPFELNLLY